MNAKAFMWAAIGVGAVVGAGLVAYNVTKRRAPRAALAGLGAVTREQRSEAKKLVAYARRELVALEKETVALDERAKKLHDRAATFEAAFEQAKDATIGDVMRELDERGEDDEEVEALRDYLGDLAAPDADAIEHVTSTIAEDWKPSIKSMRDQLDSVDDY